MDIAPSLSWQRELKRSEEKEAGTTEFKEKVLVVR